MHTVFSLELDIMRDTDCDCCQVEDEVSVKSVIRGQGSAYQLSRS